MGTGRTREGISNSIKEPRSESEMSPAQQVRISDTVRTFVALQFMHR